MPTGSHTTTTQRWPTFWEIWEILWHLLVSILWIVGACRENGKVCWDWKRTVMHLTVDLALCTTGFFIKDVIYSALTTPATIPGPVYLNVTVRDGSDIKAIYRITRDTKMHSP